MSIEFAPKAKEGRAIFVLIPLLIMHLVLLSLQITDPAGVLLIRKMVLMAQSPFINSASRISTAVGGVWTDYIELHGVRKENRELQDTVRQLSLRQKQMEEMQQENNRLRQLLSVTELSPIATIGARVIARTPDFLSSILYIDRGQKDGIRVNAPVMSGLGIVGRIVLVSTGDSQVQLITNPDASVGAMLERNRLPGVLRGSGNSRLEMNYISNTEQVELGDLVVTSGLDGIYPKGLPVGRVVDSHKGNSVFLVIKVEPSSDLIHLEEVSVLSGEQR
ncbi:MAG: rod shape-determining protein MreC [Acidobacteria bacterium]|nr:rod shape-determining protein MreC [Acidobacteriota bacterium]